MISPVVPYRNEFVTEIRVRNPSSLAEQRVEAPVPVEFTERVKATNWFLVNHDQGHGSVAREDGNGEALAIGVVVEKRLLVAEVETVEKLGSHDTEWAAAGAVNFDRRGWSHGV